ncbi:hypothetical protein RB531_1079 [Salmonella enterica subsp. enterica serovar Typhimurium]
MIQIVSSRESMQADSPAAVLQVQAESLNRL